VEGELQVDSEAFWELESVSYTRHELRRFVDTIRSYQQQAVKWADRESKPGKMHMVAAMTTGDVGTGEVKAKMRAKGNEPKTGGGLGRL
jgi:hypothetical protein